jgi:CubicO group peptidase (beta-lactamase class C family)
MPTMKIAPFIPALAAFVCTVAAQDTARMEQLVQSYVSLGQFSGSVLVARGDTVLLSKGFGSANLEWSIPNTAATKFRLGSVTKQFTAAAILLLEERGKLNTSDLVKKHLPDAPAAWDKVTIFHLLTHTSGIPSFTSMPDYAAKEPFATTPEQLVARFRDRPLEFEPGSKWSYSNSGYVLLGHLIERISGKSYAQFVQEEIFTPLGMKDSGYDSTSAIISHRAQGYAPGPNGPVHAGYIDMSVPFSAGALYSTTEDLWRWELGLFGGRLLSPKSVEKMTTPFKNDYAFGVGVGHKDGRKTIAHGGGIEGFNSHLRYDPEDRLTIVVLANLNGPAADAIAGKLGAIVRGEKIVLPGERPERTLPAATLSQYVGTYQLGPGMKCVMTLENGQLMTQVAGQPKFPVFAETETRFFLKVVDAQIDFEKDALGKVTSFTLHQNGQDVKAPRISDKAELPPERKAITVPVATLQRYVGNYELEPGFVMAITLDGEQLQTQLTGQPALPIFPESDTRFFLKVVDAQIDFVRDAQGVVTSLVLHQGGRDLPARRLAK